MFRKPFSLTTTTLCLLDISILLVTWCLTSKLLALYGKLDSLLVDTLLTHRLTLFIPVLSLERVCTDYVHDCRSQRTGFARR